MLLPVVDVAAWKLRPVRLWVQVVLNVVAVVEGDGIVRGGQAIVCHAIRAARTVWIDEDVLAPVHRKFISNTH